MKLYHFYKGEKKVFEVIKEASPEEIFNQTVSWPGVRLLSISPVVSPMDSFDWSI